MLNTPNLEIPVPDEAPDPVNTGAVLLLAGAGACGGLMFGFDVAIITGAAPFLTAAFGLGHLGLGFAFSSLLFGCVLGAAAGGWLAERYGLRRVMLWVAAMFAATTLATGAAPDFTLFNVARFLGGIAVGVVSLAAPVYVAEVAPARLRGRMGALYQMAIVSGILVSYLINYLLRNAGDDAWRYMFYTGVVPAAGFWALMLAAPETPRFLVRKGRAADALAVLTRIGGARQAARELREIELAQTPAARPVPAQGQQAQSGRFAAWRTPAVLRPLRIGAVLAVLIHLTGINTVIDYAPTIFQSAGFSMDAALFSTFVVGLANFAFTLVSFRIIDAVGRRPLYLIGSAGMALTLAALAAAVLLDRFQGMTVLVLIVLYLMFFAACIGPVFWTLLPELLPNHVRSTAMIVPVLLQWTANAVVVLFFPALFHGLGQAGTFGLLALCCAAQCVYTYLRVPETKNRSLEEIAALWEKRS